MASERIQRRIDAFLDEAEAAAGRRDWAAVSETVAAVLAIDPENEDANSSDAAFVNAGSFGRTMSTCECRPALSPARP